MWSFVLKRSKKLQAYNVREFKTKPVCKTLFFTDFCTMVHRTDLYWLCFRYMPFSQASLTICQFDCRGMQKVVIRGRPFDFLGVYGRFQENISSADWFQEKKILATKFQGDTNPTILAGNLLFSENISGLSFSLNILPVFETPPSQRKIMFSSFNQSFLARFLAVFPWFLSHFYPFGIWAWACDNFRCSNALLRLEYLYAKSWTWK